MSDKLLTVTVPAYNVEAWIDQTLTSMLQEEILDELEILVVNDGSKDRTEEIGLSYQEKYPETVRVITKENGGHGSTINTGIKAAHGRYFKVIDGDDWVDPQNFVMLVKMLARLNVDVIGSNYTWVDHESGTPTKQQEHPFDAFEYSRIYKIREIAGKVTVPMHAMTIRTEILKNMPESIDEHMFHVDMEYISFPIPFCETFIFLKPSVYRYRLGRPGQSMSLEKMQANREQHLHVLYHVQQYIEQMHDSMSEAQETYLNAIISWLFGSQLKIYISFPLGSGMRKEAVKLDHYIREHNPKAYAGVLNKGARLLMHSKYLLFPVAVLAFRAGKRTW